MSRHENELTASGGTTHGPVDLAVTIADDDRHVDVDLVARAGRTLALLGPNGAGKSTTMQTIAGMYVPRRARVAVGDVLFTDVGPGRSGVVVPAYRRGIAYLEQHPALFGHLSVLANVMFGPRSHGVAKRRARETARHWLEAVGAGELADRRVQNLSGGQAQRVAMARALATNPSVVLLDEPLAAVDAPSVAELRASLREVLLGITTVVVTHDVDDASALADDVVVLESGRVVEVGSARDVLGAPTSTFLRDVRDVRAGRAEARLGP